MTDTLARAPMHAPTTITEILRGHAERHGGRTSHIFLADGERERSRLSFLELERCAEAVALELSGRGMRGERVALVYTQGLEFIAAFCGCLAAGAIAVPIAPPRRPEACADALRIIRAAGARMVLADAPVLEGLTRMLGDGWRATLSIDVLPWLADPVQAAARVGGGPPHVPAADDLAFLQFTSGSTGDPKGVAVSHGNIVANQRAIERGFGHGEDTVVVSWLPLHHDMGLVGQLLHPLWLGVPTVMLTPQTFVRKPFHWLDTVSRYGLTVSGAPTSRTRCACAGSATPRSPRSTCPAGAPPSTAANR